MTVSEAAHFGDDVTTGAEGRTTPVQALDHGSGYLLATGIIAALCRRTTEGGMYIVDVSLAGTMKYLRSLGQYPGRSGFEGVPMLPETVKDVPQEFVDVKETVAYGMSMALKHSAGIEGVEVGYVEALKPMGSDEAVWK